MTFLSPMLLFGGLAISVPIALHFFYKARYRPVPWAAMDFLRASIEQTSRRIKFQEYILLALRCLALLLLALALARLTVSWGSGGRGESVDAVLVLDGSFSMGAKDGEKTRFERAKDAALGVIDNLPRNSTVQIVACAGGRAVTLPFTPTNLDQARSVLALLAPGSQAGDILPGLTEAYSALDRTQGTNKEVYVFSDMQKTDWERQAAAVKAKAEELKGRGAFVLVRCGNPETAVKNVAVIDITFNSTTAFPHTGTRMPFTVLLKNTGKEPVKNVAVTLEVDGKRDDIDTGLAPEISPGGTFPVTLTAKLAQPGVRLLTAKIGTPAENTQPGAGALSGNQPDDLPGDNRFDKLIPVRDKIRVLLVDGSPDPRDPKESAGHYVRNALVPVPELQREDYHVKVTEVTADLAAPAQLGDADLVVLANVPSSNADKPGLPGLSKEFVERLKKFVADGGGLLIGSGDLVVPKGYNEVFGGAGLLPFPFADPLKAPADKPFSPAPDTTEVPSFLAKLKEGDYAKVTATVDVTDALDANEGGPASLGRVMLRMDNGRPLITTKAVGSGEVIVIHTTLDAKWTNWPARAGSFVAVMRLALSHLSDRNTRGANKIAGETLAYFPTDGAKGQQFDPAKPFEVILPTGMRVPLGKAVENETDKKLTVTTDKTGSAGEYQIVAEGDAPGTGGRYAVVPDLKESENLECLNDAQVSTSLGFAPAIVAAMDSEAVGTQRNKREWTVWILLALFFVACAEAAWAWNCGRAK